MKGYLSRFSAIDVRWIARIFGALLGLLLLAEFIPPGAEWPWPIFIITALLGLLFLFVHRAAEKGKYRGEKNEINSLSASLN